MRTRFITALIGVAVLLPVLFLSHTWVLPIAAAFFAAIGTFEMMRCLGVHKDLVATVPLYLIAVAMPAVARLLDSIPSFGSMALFVLMAYFFYLMAVTLLSRGALNFGKSAEIFAAGTYITLAFSAIVMVRDCNETGKYIYLLIFIAAWITDIFAYLCGRLFGRHKLIPAVSPHKTVEGSVGGILFCMIACVVFGAAVGSVASAPKGSADKARLKLSTRAIHFFSISRFLLSGNDVRICEYHIISFCNNQENILALSNFFL
jgi:phosphatidate cytidylyltransferase